MGEAGVHRAGFASHKLSDLLLVHRLPSFRLSCQDNSVFFLVFQLELPAKGVNLLFVKDCEGFLLCKQFLCIEYSLYEVGLKLVSLIFILACTHGMSRFAFKNLVVTWNLVPRTISLLVVVSPCWSARYPVPPRQVERANSTWRAPTLPGLPVGVGGSHQTL